MPARIAPVRVSTPASVPSALVSTATSIGACSSRSKILRGSVPTGAVTKSVIATSRTRVKRSTPSQRRFADQSDRAALEDDHRDTVRALVDQRQSRRTPNRRAPASPGCPATRSRLLTNSTVCCTAVIGRSCGRITMPPRRRHRLGHPPPRDRGHVGHHHRDGGARAVGGGQVDVEPRRRHRSGSAR